MKNGKWQEYWKSIWQANILLTVLAFFISIILQLTDATSIVLVISVSLIATWWQWRPYSINAENKLILKTLQNYPAVLIKNYPHIIAFNSNPPCLTTAYQSPVPRKLLKRALPNIEGMEINVSQMGVDVFLLLKAPLTPYTQIMKVFQTFQNVIDLLELQSQAKFTPAERYQTIRLFGLENYVHKSKTSLNFHKLEITH
ncbi:MAG: hypothetical protein ACFFC7_12595 [Candidatus Hermodarchaeota archaeon]